MDSEFGVRLAVVFAVQGQQSLSPVERRRRHFDSVEEGGGKSMLDPTSERSDREDLKQDKGDIYLAGPKQVRASDGLITDLYPN